MKFLSAHWKHLLLANYRVDKKCLKDLVPKGTTIDSFDGEVYISLVAFLFDETRVLGLPVPFHKKFEEVNLRFYVKPDKDQSIRAVTFIKEIVPKRIIPLIANTFFRENYVTATMSHRIQDECVTYCWGKEFENRVSAKISKRLSHPEEGSVEEFITEHYWGFAKGWKSTTEYRVEHPQWKCCQVSDYEMQVDFAKTYGRRFAFLNSTSPYNVLYAKGSEVTVSMPGKLL